MLTAFGGEYLFRFICVLFLLTACTTSYMSEFFLQYYSYQKKELVPFYLLLIETIKLAFNPIWVIHLNFILSFSFTGLRNINKLINLRNILRNFSKNLNYLMLTMVVYSL